LDGHLALDAYDRGELPKYMDSFADQGGEEVS